MMRFYAARRAAFRDHAGNRKAFNLGVLETTE
jgi:hypothetical protein